MNAAFLLMSSAALAGADPVPAHAAPAPVVISSGHGCSNCAPPISDCGGCSKPGLLDRLRARFAKNSCDCKPACAPAPAACPAPACAPTTCCPKSCADRPNLLDTCRARWGAKKSCGPTCDPCGAADVSGCAAPLPAGAAPVTPSTPAAPPKEMPKPKPTGGNPTSAPVAPPVNGAGLIAPRSPY